MILPKYYRQNKYACLHKMIAQDLQTPARLDIDGILEAPLSGCVNTSL